MDIMQNEMTPRHTNRPVPTPLLLWLSCSTLGSILFTITYLIEGATRPGYSTLQQSISTLSLGPGGWVQQVNFIIFGLIILWTTFAWRRFLQGGRGATWYPIFRVLEGLGILLDGFFAQDPAPGYPPGTGLVPPTLHGTLHVIFAFIAIIAIACGFFVLAWRFIKEPQWRGWATASLITGILTIVFITIFGIANGQHSAIAGLFERLSTGLSTIWGIIFFTRLWLETGFGIYQHPTGSANTTPTSQPLL